MSFTYSGNPASSPRDEVRFLLGDTTAAKINLQDGEIDYLLADGASVTTASIEGARALAARHSAISATSKSVGDLSLSYEHGQTAARFEALADRLRARSGPRTFAPIMTEAPSIFTTGMDDYAD